MKKFFNTFAFLLVTVCMCLAFAACDPTPSKIELKENTLKTTVEVNDVLDFSNVVIRVTYSDKTYKDVAKNDEMTFSSVDTQTAGTKTLVIKYLGLEVSVTITVVNDITETYAVVGFERPAFASLYNQNSKNVEADPNATEDEIRNAFKQAEKPYVVGDDNAFIFKPIITALDDEDEIVILDKLQCNYKVEVLNGADYTELTGADRDNVVAIDTNTFGFDFTDAAINGTYKLSIKPTNYADLDEINFVVKVVDGYNVYNEKQLSVLDNNPNTKSIWSEFKQENNIPENINPKAVIIHDNLVLESDDIPSGYLFKEGDNDTNEKLNNTLRNWKSLYNRDTAFGEDFTLYGNYFTVDASQLPLVNIAALKELDPNTSSFGHSALFVFGGDNHNCPSTTQGNNTVESLKIIGNANRDEKTELAGGLIMFLNSSNEFTMNNTVTMAFNTSLVTTRNQDGNRENTTRISNSKWYDSFSNMCYYYGVKNNYVENSVLEGAGGPVLNLVHVDPRNHPDSHYTNVEVFNSKVETFVDGSEAWFAYNDATAVATGLFAMDQLIKGTSTQLKTAGVLQNAKSFQKTVENKQKANFMAMIAADDQLGNTYPVKGKVTVKDANGNVTFVIDMENQTLKATANAINTQMPGAAAKLPFFYSKQLATVTVDQNLQPTGLGKTPTTPFFEGPQDATLAQQFFSGDYMGIYTNGIPTIGALVEYFTI